MKIEFELNTHGYNIGERVEFRPHCGRKATLKGTIVKFGIPPMYDRFSKSSEIKEQHAYLSVRTDDGQKYTVGSWLAEKCCHKI